MGSTSEQSGPRAAADEGNVVSAVERGLFNSALEFYGAAMAVIDYRGRERPRLRWDPRGLDDVRAAMGRLEERIRIAYRGGYSAERIVRITRLEREVVEMIIERVRLHGGENPDAADEANDQRGQDGQTRRRRGDRSANGSAPHAPDGGPGPTGARGADQPTVT